MTHFLGIDTGGTYTDAVLLDERHQVVSSRKALTTPAELSLGIGNAIKGLPADQLRQVELVSLSSTLATNAIVEGRFGRACLILIGYPADGLAVDDLGKAMGDEPVVFIDGGHDENGDEQKPLDEQALRRAVIEHAGRVDAFALSGWFSVRNPVHENKARQLVAAIAGKPVTCGHELSSNLNAPRRALTAAFNARLVPLLRELIEAVQAIMTGLDIRAPLMVVKGDGSLMEAHFALEYPIETILSGPAASVVGAAFLAGGGDAVVADIGGTTTDLAILSNGKPVLNTEGAMVGGYRTMIEAIRISSHGLGGDSQVRFSVETGLSLGPRRVVPLSLLAVDRPESLDVLEAQLARENPGPEDGAFLLAARGPAELDGLRGQLTRRQCGLLDRLAAGLVPLAELYAAEDIRWYLDRDIPELLRRGLVRLAGFTPSDAAHIQGLDTAWRREAAVLGARLLARRIDPLRPPDPAEVARRVNEKLVRDSASHILAACFEDGYGLDLKNDRGLFAFLTGQAFGGGSEPGQPRADGLLDLSFTLARKLVGIGAPAAIYYPAVGRLLNTVAVIPEHAEVANAVGAVAGNVVQKALAVITPDAGGGSFRVHSESGVVDFPGLEAALRFAESETAARAVGLAGRAGALNPAVNLSRENRVRLARDGEVLIEVRVTATASGRPRWSAAGD